MRIASTILAFAALALVATACSNDASEDVSALGVGDCFNDPEANSEGVVFGMEPVRCSKSHDNEVYAVSEYPAGEDAEYVPHLRSMEIYADTFCADEFKSYVGVSHRNSRLDISFFRPSEYGFKYEGDREITCFLYDPNSKLGKSMKGSAR